MKLSTKLMFSLLACIITGFVFYNFTLKEKYNRINISDEFWEFEYKDEFVFSHISINGSNNNIVLVDYGQANSGVVYKKKFKQLINYMVNGDTLYLKFNIDPTKKNHKINKKRKLTNIIIMTNELKSITLKNSFVDLNLNNQKRIDIVLDGLTNLDVYAKGVFIDSLFINIKDQSSLDFKYDFTEIDFLQAHVHNNSKINFERIKSKRTKLFLNDSSSVNLGIGVFNSINK